MSINKLKLGFPLISLLFFIVFSFSNCHRTGTLPLPQNHFRDSILAQVEYPKCQWPYDSVITYARNLLEIDSIKSDSLFYYNLLHCVAIAKANVGELDSGLFYLHKAIAYFSRDETPYGREKYAIALNNCGMIHSYYGNPEKSLVYLDSAAAVASGNNLNRISIHVNLLKSSVAMGLDRYGEAIECVENSIKLSHQIGDSALMISSHQAYADIYTNCRFFDEALEQLEEVSKYKDHFTSHSAFSHYNGKGRMYFLQGKNSEAKSEFLKAHENIDPNEIIDKMIVTFNLAEVYLNMGLTDSAKTYLDTIQKNTRILTYLPLFNAQYKSLKGDYFAQTDQFENASDAFSMADSVFNTLTFDNVLLKLHLERKSRFFGKTGDYKRAWGANIKLSEINENILNENNRRQVSSLKYKYQRDTTLLAQRNTIALNGQKLKTYRARQFIFIAVLIALILLAGFIYLFFRKKRELQYQQNMRKVATLKMQNLRGRLSPHFLFNVLNNVWASMENKENARHQFDNLSRLIKQSLVNADEISIPLDEEINFVKSFIELQKNGSGSKFTVNWAIEPNLNHIQVPGMILQIPVENAIKHGIQNDLDGLLTIKACKKGHNLLLEVTDNGPGGLAKKPANGTGTGLKVLNSTIYLLNQINSNKMTMKMLEPNSGENTGTKVTITIPLDFNFNLN